MDRRFWIYFLIVAFNFSSCKKKPDSVDPPPTLPSEKTFANPILSSGPDPWIVKQGNTYYYTHTLGNRIALWKTTKVTELRNTNPLTIWSAPATGPDSRNLWAPEVHFINNKWYVYYAADDGNIDNHRMFVLENSSLDPLAGTWVSKGKISDPTNKWAIDGTVFEHNGQLYFLWSGWEGDVNIQQNIYIAKMSNPWTINGDRILLSSPLHEWEKIGNPDVNEAPQILKNQNGKFFLIYSASGCWSDDYALGMLTLKTNGDPANPLDWIKSPTPVFTKNTSASAFGPGHNSFFKSADGTEDWIIYHANPQSNLGCNDSRSPRIQKFTWNADGTPNFGTPVGINTHMNKPSGE